MILHEIIARCEPCREEDHEACQGRRSTVTREADTGMSYVTSCCCVAIERYVNLDDTSAAVALGGME
jgi:hypothetical protein